MKRISYSLAPLWGFAGLCLGLSSGLAHAELTCLDTARIQIDPAKIASIPHVDFNRAATERAKTIPPADAFKLLFRCCSGTPSAVETARDQWCNAGYTEKSGLHRTFTDDSLAMTEAVGAQGIGCPSGFKVYTCWPRFQPYRPLGGKAEKCEYVTERPLAQVWSGSAEVDLRSAYPIQSGKAAHSTASGLEMQCKDGSKLPLCLARARCTFTKDGTPFAGETLVTCRRQADGRCPSAQECADDPAVSAGSTGVVTLPQHDSGTEKSKAEGG